MCSNQKSPRINPPTIRYGRRNYNLLLFPYLVSSRQLLLLFSDPTALSFPKFERKFSSHFVFCLLKMHPDHPLWLTKLQFTCVSFPAALSAIYKSSPASPHSGRGACHVTPMFPIFYRFPSWRFGKQFSKTIARSNWVFLILALIN